jgi:hypothetical protein
MRFFRKRINEGIEGRLRGLSGEPRNDFVSELSGHIRESRVRTTMRSRRFVAALVSSALMLIPFVAFGGVNYAAAAAKNAVQAVAKQSKANKSNSNKVTPAQDQYRPGKGCGDKNHIHEREGECKKPPK